jgi:hypothetical protein
MWDTLERKCRYASMAATVLNMAGHPSFLYAALEVHMYTKQYI